MRATISWTGQDNAGGSGITRYTLQRSINGGSYSTVSSSLTKTSLDVLVANGSTYRFRVRGLDRDGNVSSYATGASFKGALSQQTSGAIVYSSGWSTQSSTSYSGGSVKYRSVNDATATFTFTGRSVSWVATKGTTRGVAYVYVDNALRAYVDLYASSTKYRQQVFQYAWATSGSHTVRVTVWGTPSRPRVDVDAFAVLR